MGAQGVSDEEAYRRFLCGDERGATLLVERYGDSLTLYIHSYVHDAHEAEDLMIEAFSRVFAKERPITRDGHFKAYLYKTGRNLALRYLRGHRLPFVGLDDVGFDPAADEQAETELARGERQHHLFAAMEELRPDYREALYLVYFEEMSYREAASVMGRTEGQVAKLVHRGKRGLRSLLEQGGFGYANN